MDDNRGPSREWLTKTGDREAKYPSVSAGPRVEDSHANVRDELNRLAGERGTQYDVEMIPRVVLREIAARVEQLGREAADHRETMRYQRSEISRLDVLVQESKVEREAREVEIATVAREMNSVLVSSAPTAYGGDIWHCVRMWAARLGGATT